MENINLNSPMTLGDMTSDQIIRTLERDRENAHDAAQESAFYERIYQQKIESYKAWSDFVIAYQAKIKLIIDNKAACVTDSASLSMDTNDLETLFNEFKKAWDLK